jgi:hypothetical protein
MLQEQFDILGYWDDEIYFKLNEKIIRIKKKLPKEDLILQLKVEPEDVKALRDEILVQASKLPLTYDQRTELSKEI